MLRSRSFDLTTRIYDDQDAEKLPTLRASVGADLHELAKDRAIVTDPEETRRRRTIRLTRPHSKASWGFTLQTYGIRNKRSREVEVMSYVDYVEIHGPAWFAGMKKGDVILSVNGESVESCTHRELVGRIQRAGRELRLVVLFEDCCRKVELQERYIKLKKVLSLKIKTLQQLEAEESRLLKGEAPLSLADEELGSTPSLLSRLSVLRQSSLSHRSIYSSASSDWDAYSEITSPQLLDNVPVNQFAFDGGSMSDVSSFKESILEASLSSSGSQSEIAAADFRISDSNLENEGASHRGQETESGEMGGVSDIEDSNTSMSSLDGSVSQPDTLTLSDVMTSHDHQSASGRGAATPNPPSLVESTFLQMYTVARWVSVVRSNHMSANAKHVSNRRFSTGMVALGDVRKVGRVRSLSSVHEGGEDGPISEGSKAGAHLVRKDSVKDKSSRGAAAGDDGSNGGDKEGVYHSSSILYPGSESEDSASVVSDDAGDHMICRGRKGTVIHVDANGLNTSSATAASATTKKNGDGVSQDTNSQSSGNRNIVTEVNKNNHSTIVTVTEKGSAVTSSNLIVTTPDSASAADGKGFTAAAIIQRLSVKSHNVRDGSKHLSNGLPDLGKASVLDKSNNASENEDIAATGAEEDSDLFKVITLPAPKSPVYTDRSKKEIAQYKGKVACKLSSPSHAASSSGGGTEKDVTDGLGSIPDTETPNDKYGVLVNEATCVTKL